MACCGNNNPDRNCCGDFSDPEVPDMGGLFPRKIRIDCEAPEIPANDCDEADPEVVYDAETESFKIYSIVYDENCSAILDQDDSPILTEIG